MGHAARKDEDAEVDPIAHARAINLAYLTDWCLQRPAFLALVCSMAYSDTVEEHLTVQPPKKRGRQHQRIG